MDDLWPDRARQPQCLPVAAEGGEVRVNTVDRPAGMVQARDLHRLGQDHVKPFVRAQVRQQGGQQLADVTVDAGKVTRGRAGVEEQCVVTRHRGARPSVNPFVTGRR